MSSSHGTITEMVPNKTSTLPQDLLPTFKDKVITSDTSSVRLLQSSKRLGQGHVPDHLIALTPRVTLTMALTENTLIGTVVKAVAMKALLPTVTTTSLPPLQRKISESRRPILHTRARTLIHQVVAEVVEVVEVALAAISLSTMWRMNGFQRATSSTQTIQTSWAEVDAVVVQSIITIETSMSMQEAGHRDEAVLVIGARLTRLKNLEMSITLIVTGGIITRRVAHLVTTALAAHLTVTIAHPNSEAILTRSLQQVKRSLECHLQ